MGDFLTEELELARCIKLMVYTKRFVFLPFCGGLKSSLLCPKWDLGSEMIAGEHSSISSQSTGGKVGMELPGIPMCSLVTFLWVVLYSSSVK